MWVAAGGEGCGGVGGGETSVAAGGEEAAYVFC